MEQEEEQYVCAVCGDQANWIISKRVEVNNGITYKESLLCTGISGSDCFEMLKVGQSWFLTFKNKKKLMFRRFIFLVTSILLVFSPTNIHFVFRWLLSSRARKELHKLFMEFTHHLGCFCESLTN